MLAPLILIAFLVMDLSLKEEVPSRVSEDATLGNGFDPPPAAPAECKLTTAVRGRSPEGRQPLDQAAQIEQSPTRLAAASTPAPASAAPATAVERNTKVEIFVTSELDGGQVAGARVELGFTPRGSDEEVLRVLESDDHGRVQLALGPGRAGTLRALGWSERMTGGPVFLDIVPDVLNSGALKLNLAFEVAGRVVDASTGLPVEGANVSFWTFSERDTVLSRADGSFLHRRFPLSKFAEQVHVSAAGYGASIRYLTIAADGSWELPGAIPSEATRQGTGTPFVEIALVPETRIVGRVLDDAGRPVAGALAVAEGYYRIRPDVASRDMTRSITDEKGIFELSGLRSDVSHGVVVQAAGFAEATLEVQDAAGIHDLGDVWLEGELVLSGVVLDPNGLPVEDIEVRLLRLDVESGSLGSTPEALDVAVRIEGAVFDQRTPRGGTFLFEHLRDIPYRLFLRREDQTLVTRDLAPGALLAQNSLELVLPPKCVTLEGQLVGAAGSATSMHGAIVEARRRGHVARVTVGVDGSFRIAGLDNGAPYTLTASYASEHSTFKVALWAEEVVWGFERPVLRMEPVVYPRGLVLARNELK